MSEISKGLTIEDLSKVMKSLKPVSMVRRVYMNSKDYRNMLNLIDDKYPEWRGDKSASKINMLNGILLSEQALYPDNYIGLEYDDIITLIDMKSGKKMDVPKADGISGLGCLKLREPELGNEHVDAKKEIEEILWSAKLGDK